jgi:hypothetical protein
VIVVGGSVPLTALAGDRLAGAAGVCCEVELSGGEVTG